MNVALLHEIERLAQPSVGTVGVSVRHLETGEAIALRGETWFPMASTFKIAVAGAALHAVGEGALVLDRMLAIGTGDRIGPGGIAEQFPHDGIMLSVHNLLEAMLTQSDNTATDMLMAQIGGAAAVTGWLRSIGIEGQQVDRTTRELLRDFFELAPGQSLKDALARRPELEVRGVSPHPAYDDDPRDGSTPNAMVALLAVIHGGTALGAERSRLLLDSLSRCATGDARFRGCLPPGTRVAHKTGTIGGTVNDAGILTMPDGAHIAVAVFVKKSAAPFPLRERTIAEIVRAIYNAFLPH